MIVPKISLYLGCAIFCFFLPGCTKPEQSGTQDPSSMPSQSGGVAADLMNAASSEPVATEVSADEPAESDFDEPETADKLAFIEQFATRLQEGASIADLLKPEVSFVYLVESECAALTTGNIDALPAGDIDTDFSFDATYSWENPDCDEVPPETDMVLVEFNLEEVVSGWSQIEATAEDYSFDAFSLLDPARDDYLMVFIEAYGETYAVSQIEYRLEIY